MKKYLKKVLFILVFLLLIIGITYLYLGYAPKPLPPKLAANIQASTIKVGNLERSYLFYIPKNLPANAPLILVFHASMQDGQAMRVSTVYEFERLADKENFVVVYPNGYKNNWNDCRKTASYPAKTMNIDDKAFVSSLIEKFSSEYKIDTKRVFATGYSNGGHLAFRLAMEMPDKIAAVAAIAASLPTPSNNDCEELNQPIPVMIINGTKDPINPYNGGEVTLYGFGSRGTVLSSSKSAEYFAKAYKAVDQPKMSTLPNQEQRDLTKVLRYEYQIGNPTQTKVVLYAVENGGHVVPQPFYNAPKILGQTSQDINAPLEIWNFFAQQLPH
ncbi:MAG: dienelactone hydrolase family protein [Acidobacteria bacterium]|nr:dienelactone hydrolase family protein [Acidobacteriota bacterium]